MNHTFHIIYFLHTTALSKTNLDQDEDIPCFIKFILKNVHQASGYKAKAMNYNCSIDFRCTF